MRDFAVGAARARQPVGGLLLRLRRHADPGRPAARPLRAAPADYHLARCVCAGGCVLFATGGSLAAVTAGRFLIGASAAFSLVGCHGGRRSVVPRRSLRHPFRWGHGHGHGRRRVRPSAAAPRRRGLGLAHDATCCWRPAVWRWLVAAWATVRDRWRGTGGVANALAGLGIVVRHPPDLADRADRARHVRAAAGLRQPLGRAALETAYGCRARTRRPLTSMLFVGWGVGAPLFGWLSDRIGRRKAPLLAGLALETAGALRPSSTSPVCPCLRWAACASWSAFSDRPRSCASRWPRRITPAERQRHGNRLRQRHGDGGGRPVPAARRPPARPRLDRRDRARRARLPNR
mgnify:CR=1 FL=1